MNDLTWAATVRLVHQRAGECCEYCQTCLQAIAQTMHVEHIKPRGGDLPDNLCLSCPSCNLIKNKATTAVDPVTGVAVLLFNPRTQKWDEHFRWSADAIQIEGLTPEARATIDRLRMNRDDVLTARQVWIAAGVHPPQF